MRPETAAFRAAVRRRTVTRHNAAGRREARDHVVTEEPMEIRVLTRENGRVARHSISVTMRTPGHDLELAAGFLFTEGVVHDPGEIEGIDHCPAPAAAPGPNVVNVSLREGTPFDPARFTRNVYTTSSCGVCGKTSLELVRVAGGRRVEGAFTVEGALLADLPNRLRTHQAVFARTGGLHAAALYDREGRVLLVREDVGRHNALDKIVGRRWLDGELPLADSLLLLSGRTGFELVQKAILGGIPLVASVGAPTSLALEMAEEFGLTVVGFLTPEGFNVYTGHHRVV